MNILEKLYLFFYQRHNKEALQNQKRLPFPVISVGNLTLGGTGKTPFTIALAKESQKREFTPIILTRGYGGKLKGPLVISAEYKADDVGDEPLMMFFEGLTVIKSIDRYRGGLFAMEKLGIKGNDNPIFILDDGFQHKKLYRDINILLIDGIKGFGNKKLFPLGPLRSPLEEIREADIIFITKEKNFELDKQLMNFEVNSIYNAQIEIKGLVGINNKKIEPKGQKIFAFAGVGNFESFLKSLNLLNLNIIGHRKFIDHKKYTKLTIRKIIKDAKNSDLIVTTKKDFIKIVGNFGIDERFCYLDISLSIQKEALVEIFSKLDNIRNIF